MKLIIDIPEDLYGGIERRDGALETEYVCDELMKAVDNAIPLEKHDEEVIKETVASVWGKPPYIELLDKIRVELHATAEMHEDDVYYLREEWIDEIINKYKIGETRNDS